MSRGLGDVYKRQVTLEQETSSPPLVRGWGVGILPLPESEEWGALVSRISMELALGVPRLPPDWSEFAFIVQGNVLLSLGFWVRNQPSISIHITCLLLENNLSFFVSSVKSSMAQELGFWVSCKSGFKSKVLFLFTGCVILSNTTRASSSSVNWEK